MGFQAFSISNFSNSKFFFLLSFLIPSVVRVLPEILMGKYIVGFDTVSYYVPVTLRWIDDGVGFFEFVAYAPLFYVLLVGLFSLGVPLAVSLKVLPPLLYGFLGVAIFLFSRKVLGWSYLKGLFASCLATLYFVALRISWDMLRSELGLIFLFAFLIFLHIGSAKSLRKSFGLLLPSMALVVLSHQLVSVIMFTIVFVLVLQKLVRQEYVAVRNLVLSALPSVFLFALVVYSKFVASLPSANQSGWFSLFGFSSFSDTVWGTLGFLLFCYLPLFPFVIVGFWKVKSLELKVWVFWCLIGIALAVAFPVFVVGYRWALLLVFPLVFFAAEGVERFNFDVWKRVFLACSIFLSLSIVFLPTEYAFPYFRAFPYYVPSSMLQNSVSLSDCEDVVRALAWVDAGLGSDGVLLVHDAFHGWALLYLSGSSRVVCYGYGDPEVAAWELFETGVRRLFVVWWVSAEGWHGQASLSSCFVEVFRSGRIAVYAYDSAV